MAVQAPARRKRVSWLTVREWLEGYFFASPFIIGFLVFTAFPMLYSIWLSFQKWDLLSPPIFVGLQNFVKVFTDPDANLSLYNSAYYTFLAVPFQLVIAFVLALALSQPLKFRDLYRAGFYLPIIVPIVASAVVWQRVFHPEVGILNNVLGWVGIPPQNWLFDANLAKPAFIFMSFWMIGRQMVIFIAGLGNIPQSMYEAASIDGANNWHQFRKITLPMISPSIFFNLVIGIIGSFQVFTTAFVATNGGPQNATLFYVLYLYRNAFEYFKMGYASALAWMLFIIVLVLTMIQFRVAKAFVYYEVEEAR